MSSTNTNDNTVAAYQSVIDFNKTIISITSTILAALISYLVFQNYNLSIRNLISPIILVISLICSLFGFGYAIPAINKSVSKKAAITFSNIGAGIMLIGIIAIVSIEEKEKINIKNILVDIENSLKSVDSKLTPQNCKSFELTDQNYILQYKHDSINIQIIYSLDKEKITSVKRK